MRAVVYEPMAWHSIKEWLLKEYGLVNCFAWNLKDNFGFSVREHSEWVTEKSAYTKDTDTTDLDTLLIYEQDGWFKNKRKEHTVRLDFDDEDSRTMWLLRCPYPPREI